METANIKEKFHNLIDLIDDDDVLGDFYQALNDYHERDRKKDIIDDLTDAQKARLKESLRQSDSGKTIPHDVLKAEINRWAG